MELKAGVTDGPDGASPVLWLFLGAIAHLHREYTGEGLVITSLWRPPGARPSLHSPDAGSRTAAADLRRWELDHLKKAQRFAYDLRDRWGDQLGVVLEPEELTAEQLLERGGASAVASHIHVQLKAGAWPRAL